MCFTGLRRQQHNIHIISICIEQSGDSSGILIAVVTPPFKKKKNLTSIAIHATERDWRLIAKLHHAVWKHLYSSWLSTRVRFPCAHVHFCALALWGRFNQIIEVTFHFWHVVRANYNCNSFLFLKCVLQLCFQFFLNDFYCWQASQNISETVDLPRRRTWGCLSLKVRRLLCLSLFLHSSCFPSHFSMCRFHLLHSPPLASSNSPLMRYLLLRSSARLFSSPSPWMSR